MNPLLQVDEDVITLLGWPTDVVKIQPSSPPRTPAPPCYDNPRHNTHSIITDPPHTTILFFVPGNPGCIGWYISTLSSLVHRMNSQDRSSSTGTTKNGVVVAYGVSYAGHSPHPDRTRVTPTAASTTTTSSTTTTDEPPRSPPQRRPLQVAWTIEGQVQHKIAFYDHVMKEYTTTTTTPHNHPSTTRASVQPSPSIRIIWISHSIGGHMVERILLLRKDILTQTKGVIHLMPFIRMKTLRQSDQYLLDWAAARPHLVTSMAQLLLQLVSFVSGNRGRTQGLEQHPPRHIPILMEEPRDQQLAWALLRQPWFARNFFELGLEEIRDVGEGIDVPALQYILKHCPIAMLYAGKDHWGPQFHVDELRQLLPTGADSQGAKSSTMMTTSIVPDPHPNYRLHVSYRPDLRHDYVSYTHMKEIVADWCLQQVTEFQRVGSGGENHAPLLSPTSTTTGNCSREPSPAPRGLRHSKL